MKVVDCYNHPSAMILSGRSKGKLRSGQGRLICSMADLPIMQKEEVWLLRCALHGSGRERDRAVELLRAQRWAVGRPDVASGHGEEMVGAASSLV